MREITLGFNSCLRLLDIFPFYLLDRGRAETAMTEQVSITAWTKGRILPIAQKYRLPAVYLFGSYARGAATEDSDLDLLVDTAGTELKSLFSLGSL